MSRRWHWRFRFRLRSTPASLNRAPIETAGIKKIGS